ncbi:hypothetical protein DPMN_053244 [Dreissena polymorpha]|uniref:Uncharacterized protein n=1 Tax=Dreissena polymorpha TaxID=45954 RepID=A0A9D4CMY8_DREPO|nr:hypothetical protein DPMN_053244 [Dreissena polymorpha]
MDLSIASSPDSTSFATLTVVTDPYVHAQNYQQNYTAVIVSIHNYTTVIVSIHNYTTVIVSICKTTRLSL